jgi:hypothetical protein
MFSGSTVAQDAIRGTEAYNNANKQSKKSRRQARKRERSRAKTARTATAKDIIRTPGGPWAMPLQATIEQLILH